jgi:hypothetical protein
MNQSVNEMTREKRHVLQSDGGFLAHENRIASEVYYVPAPCDVRETTVVFGDSSRLVGRSPMLRKK